LGELGEQSKLMFDVKTSDKPVLRDSIEPTSKNKRLVRQAKLG